MTAIKGMAILIIIMGHLGNIFGVRVFNPLGSCGVAIFILFRVWFTKIIL